MTFAQGRDVAWADMPAGMGFFAQGRDVPVSQMPAGMAFGTPSSFNFNNLGRLAGSVAGLAGLDVFSNSQIQESTKKLQEEADRVRQEIDRTIGNIYPALTGLTGPEAMKKYYDAFAKTVQDTTARGRADLTADPNISKQYNTLSNRINSIQQGNLNLSNLVGGYAQLAKDPPVVSLDPAKIRAAGDWTAPGIASQYKQFTSYSDPQTSQFISGVQRPVADAIGRYYNTSSDFAGLMNYGTLA